MSPVKPSVSLMQLVDEEQAKIDVGLVSCVGVDEPKGKKELHFHFKDGCAVEIHTEVTDNPQHIALAAAISHARSHGLAPEQKAAQAKPRACDVCIHFTACAAIRHAKDALALGFLTPTAVTFESVYRALAYVCDIYQERA